MKEEAALHSTASYIEDSIPSSSTPPNEFLEFEQEEFDYPIQHRIDNEWANLLGPSFTPARNVAVFRDKVEQFRQLASNPDAISRDDFFRKFTYIKLGALIVANSYKKSVAKHTEERALETLPGKYPSDFVTEERLKGRSITEIRLGLREAFNRGEICVPEGIEIPPEEQDARMPRIPAYKDERQDLVDAWQRATYGTALPEHDTIGVALGEVDELLEEFDGLSDEEINGINDDEKLEQILGEVADVDIAIGGVFAAENECVDAWQNFALDRMIDTYGDVPKLRRMGVPTEVAMDFLSNCRYREDNGLPRPVDKRIPDYYKGPTFQIHAKSPHELDSSREMIH